MTLNDKYLADRQCIIEYKLDCLAVYFNKLYGGFSNVNPNIKCPFCTEEIKYNFATDGAVVRKCGCSTGKTSIDINSFSPTPTK